MHRDPRLESAFPDDDATLRTLTPECAEAVLVREGRTAPEQPSFWDGERFVSWIRVESS